MTDESVYPQWNDRATTRNKILNNELTSAEKRRSRIYRKRASLWTTCPCCTSLSSIILSILACFLVAALILAVILPILLTSSSSTSTIEATTIFLSNNSTVIINNTTSTISSSTTGSTSTTTTNICTAGYTYSTQLLYLSMNSYISWTYYSFNYTSPNVTSLTLIFSLRSDPNYWYVDDVSVTNSSGQELLSNGGFEQGSFANWVYCNPKNATASGSISGSHICNGNDCYKDGSIGAFDYLSQTFIVRPNQVYTVEFWLALDVNFIVNMTFASITISY